MKTVKRSLIFFLFLYLLIPVKVCLSQETTESEIVQQDESGAKDKKADKKKKVFEINEQFYLSLAIDLVTVALIILFIYYPNYRKLDYIFTFITFNVVIFLLTIVLKYVKLSMGAVFGLFAVFSILRYRTAGISMKDMTYLFIFIAMGLIGAIQLEMRDLIVLYGIIFLGTFILDSNLILRRELCKRVQYENIELIRPEHYDELVEDLKKRTGLNIHRVSISRINFLRDSAVVRVYYYERGLFNHNKTA
jgi:hypothetical protein